MLHGAASLVGVLGLLIAVSVEHVHEDSGFRSCASIGLVAPPHVEASWTRDQTFLSSAVAGGFLTRKSPVTAFEPPTPHPPASVWLLSEPSLTPGRVEGRVLGSRGAMEAVYRP